MRHQKFGADFVADFSDVGIGGEPGGYKDELAGERIAVGVEAEGGQREQKVPSAHRARFHNPAALDHAHDKTGQIIFAGGVSIGQFGGFASDEGASGVVAGAGHALDKLLDDFRIHAGHGEIVEKK